MREKSTTMLFNYAITDAATNPFKMATPFGPPVTIQQGDLFAKCDEQERLLEEAAEACRALIAWDDSERKGPDYGSLTRATHPHGELIWKQWWDSQSALCERSFDTARAFLAKLEARDA